MKKRSTLLFSFLVGFALAFSSCSSNSSTVVEEVIMDSVTVTADTTAVDSTAVTVDTLKSVMPK